MPGIGGGGSGSTWELNRLAARRAKAPPVCALAGPTLHIPAHLRPACACGEAPPSNASSPLCGILTQTILRAVAVRARVTESTCGEDGEGGSAGAGATLACVRHGSPRTARRPPACVVRRSSGGPVTPERPAHCARGGFGRGVRRAACGVRRAGVHRAQGE